MVLAFCLTQRMGLTILVCLGFLFGGWMFGPDLDIHSVQYKRWGWLRWIWLPYRHSMRHRSPYSHAPIIGTIGRVLYFSFWVALASLVMVDLLNAMERTALTWGDLGNGLAWGLRRYWQEWLAFLVGLELGALSHYSSDWLVSSIKSTLKHKRSAKSSRSRSRRKHPRKR